MSVKVSKALADEPRLRMFQAISATYHIKCGEIVATRGVSGATVSHHLKILSQAGLIVCRREGSAFIARPCRKPSQPRRRHWRKLRAAGEVALARRLRCARPGRWGG